jgi:hypothetical protein
MTVVAETFVFPGSSNLSQASYDPSVENLDVEFSDGSVYTYFNVPAGTYRGLTLAPSAGGYFHRHIKGRYGYERKD